MNRWEYLLIEVLDGVVMDFPQGVPKNVSEKELEAFSTTEGYFNWLGSDGWELICSGGEENTLYTFKRERGSDQAGRKAKRAV